MSNLSTDQDSVPTETSILGYSCCSIQPDGNSYSPSDSPRLVLEYPPDSLHRRQLRTPQISLREGGSRSIPHTSHAAYFATPRHTVGVIPNPGSGPFNPSGENLSDVGRPCATTVGWDVVRTGVQIDANGQLQEEVDLNHRLSYARIGPLPSDEGSATGEIHLLSPAILQDAALLVSTTPDIPDQPVLYNPDWSFQDMIKFIGFAIDEKPIKCLWVSLAESCNDDVKVKDIKTHLQRKHGVLHSHHCLWSRCSYENLMKLSSLERHIQETHTSLMWVCPKPTCGMMFTRRYNLLKHTKQCIGPGSHVVS